MVRRNTEAFAEKLVIFLLFSASINLGTDALAFGKKHNTPAPIANPVKPELTYTPKLHGEGPWAEIIPVEEGDARVTPKFSALGNMYEIGNLIWSGVPEELRDWKGSIAFCKTLGRGSRLPTREEYEALGRAMGYPNEYDDDLLPDMSGNMFWSSSPYGKGSAWYFSGASVNNYVRDSYNSVRCVRAANF
ncbi:MAG: hypothetical protein ABI041_04960 [Bdellovibrionia bacterium]